MFSTVCLVSVVNHVLISKDTREVTKITQNLKAGAGQMKTSCFTKSFIFHLFCLETIYEIKHLIFHRRAYNPMPHSVCVVNDSQLQDV